MLRFGIGVPAESPVPVGQAWSNEVWRIRTASGLYAVKLFPPSMSTTRRRQLDAGMAFEESVLQTGLVPVPQPVAATDDWLIEVQTPSGPRLARCHTWVPGTPALRPLNVDLIRTAGRYLAFLHGMGWHGGDTSQLPAFDTDRWQQAVQAAVRQRLDWADQLANLTPLISGLTADLDVLRNQRRPMRISHHDYDPKNAVIDVNERLVITDWDYAGPVLPNAELIVAATSFASTVADVQAFVGAYREAGGDAAAADSLALTSEAADLDWLLRNVEACLIDDPVTAHDQYVTAGTLIASFPADVATLFAWPNRLAQLLR